eukprot:6114199-Amphidinium_carterae.1
MQACYGTSTRRGSAQMHKSSTKACPIEDLSERRPTVFATTWLHPIKIDALVSKYVATLEFETGPSLEGFCFIVVTCAFLLELSLSK